MKEFSIKVLKDLYYGTIYVGIETTYAYKLGQSTDRMYVFLIWQVVIVKYILIDYTRTM